MTWGERELVVRQTATADFADGAKAFPAIAPEHCVVLETGPTAP